MADFPKVSAWRPRSHNLVFREANKKLAWLTKFELSLADATWSLQKHTAELKELREIVSSRASAYQRGANIEEVIADLKRLGGAAPTDMVDDNCALPADQIVALFPGAACFLIAILYVVAYHDVVVYLDVSSDQSLIAL
jgi:hypothetical protein